MPSVKAERQIGSVGDVPRNESDLMTPPTAETESSPQPLSPAAAEGKRQSDTLRAKARGKHCNASRAVKREADSEEIELIDQLAEAVEKPKSKGGRPPGAKSRHPALIAVERVLRAINRKNQQWIDNRSEHFYIRVLQLAAKLIPQSAVDGVTGEKTQTTLRLRFAERELVCSKVAEGTDRSVPLGSQPDALAPVSPGLVTADDILIAVRDGGPAAQELKALIMGQVADKLAAKAEQLRRRREEEKADELKLRAEQRRERMYTEGRWQQIGGGRFDVLDN